MGTWPVVVTPPTGRRRAGTNLPPVLLGAKADEPTMAVARMASFDMVWQMFEATTWGETSSDRLPRCALKQIHFQTSCV